MPKLPWFVMLVVVMVGCGAAEAPGAAAPRSAEVELPAPANAGPVPPSAASTEEEAARSAPQPSGKRQGAAVGGSRWGFPLASSLNGRLVVLRTFEGSEAPSFGHHGEASVSATIAVYDLVSGTERVVADLIDVDSERRYFLVLDSGPEVIDAQTGAATALPGADPGDDGNRCLPPRQASFSFKGARVGWVSKDGKTLLVRDLATGVDWKVPSTERIWRGFPDDSGRGAVLLEVPAGSTGWPLQNTSCACRWCNRFAMSYGFYGWSGPAFAPQHVAEDGTRAPGELPDGEARWHGKTQEGCELTPEKTDGSLDHGPWRWVCP